MILLLSFPTLVLPRSGSTGMISGVYATPNTETLFLFFVKVVNERCGVKKRYEVLKLHIPLKRYPDEVSLSKSVPIFSD
jgi:hypothetical protein